MKNIVQKTIAFMAPMALLTSCASVSYEQVAYDVLQPAMYTLPAWVDTIIVCNAAESAEFSDLTIDTKNEDAVTSAKMSQEAMCGNICKAVAERFNESGYVDAIYDESPAPLTAERINSLVAKHKNTVILALTDLKASTELDGPYDVDCVHMTCVTDSRFCLMASSTAKEPLDMRHDTLIFTSCGDYLEEIVNGLPQIHAQYEERAEDVGNKTAEMFIPSWARVRRIIYTTTDKEFTSASTWVKSGDWDEARNLWIEAYTSTSKKATRIHAALNIALSYEREDDTVQASMWCSKALDDIETLSSREAENLAQEKNMANQMFKYLMERTEQKADLDKQM